MGGPGSNLQNKVSAPLWIRSCWRAHSALPVTEISDRYWTGPKASSPAAATPRVLLSPVQPTQVSVSSGDTERLRQAPALQALPEGSGHVNKEVK